jgi:hypothetical protein
LISPLGKVIGRQQKAQHRQEQRRFLLSLSQGRTQEFWDEAARAKASFSQQHTLPSDQQMQEDSSARYCSGQPCDEGLAPARAAAPPAAAVWPADTHGEH